MSCLLRKLGVVRRLSDEHVLCYLGRVLIGQCIDTLVVDRYWQRSVG